MMPLARKYRPLEFEELKPFLCDELIMHAVRIATNFVLVFKVANVCMYEAA